MREILFRGKSTDNGEWVEGTYFPPANTLISYKLELIDGVVTFMDFCVIPETVGQYTGLTDKNGKKIFEGDIIRKTNEGRHPKIFTANIRTNFRVNEEVYYGPCDHFTESCEYEIIGNIHDNSELLKGGEE